MRNAVRRQAAEAHPGGGIANAVEGEMTRTVRVIGLAIAGLVTVALLAGIWKGSTSAQPGTGALVDGLMVSEVILAGILILLGSIVEGFGYG
ncbi:MAG: hypothetical protein ACYCZC_10420, partial [Acidithiobacillus sp.]